MSRNRIALILILFALSVTALLFRRPVQSWAATQSCLRMARDHYSNIEMLAGAPDFDAYMDTARLQCRAEVAYDRFEQADTEERRRQGTELVALYSELIEISHGGTVYRPRRAAIYASLGQYDRALADYNFLILHDPENFWMLEQRGELYAQMGRYEQALADFEALHERARSDPGSTDAYLARLEARIEALAAER